ncbi:MAG: zf-HC2 domain-containing protein [Gemmatimonadales bacterium]
MHAGNDIANGHLSAAVVAAYLDRTLDGARRRDVENHLADCDACRAEVVDVARALRRGSGRRVWYVIGPAAAAAAVAVLMLGQPREAGIVGDDVVRGPGVVEAGEGIERFETVAPSGDAPVGRDSLVFIWRPLGDDASYRLTVTEETGEELWTVVTVDTIAVLPDDVAPARDAVYFWYVDALLPDGRSATTGVREFRTER